MKIRILLFSTALFAAVTAQGQTQFQPEDVKYDLAVLRATWESVHAGLYRYNTNEQITQYFKDLDAKTDKPLSLRQFYIYISQLNTKLRCGHSFVSYYNNRKAIKEELYSKIVMPLLFRILNERFIVTHVLARPSGIEAGDEIVSINGVDSKIILDSLLTVSKADGRNGRNKQLDNIGVRKRDISAEQFCLFDIYFPLFFKENINNLNYAIMLKRRGRMLRVEVQGITKQERESLFATHYGRVSKQQESWYLKELDKQSALLRLGDFATYNWKFDFRKYLDSIFTLVKQRPYENLIVDIRENEGGADDARDAVLSYLSPHAFGCANPVRRLYRYLSIPDTLLANLNSWDDSFKKPKSGYIKTDDGYYEVAHGKSLCAEIIPNAKAFSGKLFLICDATNSSATFVMADYVKRNKIGTLIGETTGGSQQGINGGQIFFFYLPRTKIEMDVPLIWQRPVDARPDEGVIPDYEVETTPIDVARQSDPQLEFILKKLIK